MSIANCKLQIAKLHWKILGLVVAVLVVQGSAQSPAPGSAFTYRKVMIPVRDGVRLETVIMAPANAPWGAIEFAFVCAMWVVMMVAMAMCQQIHVGKLMAVWR
jgi:predicted metal-binding membrane protein